MSPAGLLVLSALLLGAFAVLFARARKRRREAFIEAFRFPDAVLEKTAARYPHLDAGGRRLVERGLRDYFHACNDAGRQLVSMPSQVVDVAWHEFILFTRRYQEFCGKSFGRFLHHTPAEAMRSPTEAQEGIRRAWRHACKRQQIDPRQPERLPLLFAIDGLLAIGDGFRYELDCTRSEGHPYCAGHIGCGSCGGDGDGGCGGGCGGD